MSDSLQRLLEILDLERIEVNLFRGQNPTDSRRRLFGGQVLAQGLVAALREGAVVSPLPVEIRTVGGLRMFEATSRPPHTNSWVRAKGRLPDDPAIHQCVLAYASDMTLLSNAVNAHPIALASSNF